MKILHISDTHGGMPALKDVDEVDVIVHSGDLMPNRSYGIRAIEEPFQDYWLNDNAVRLHAWLGTEKPVLICPGNHDFVYAAPYLKRFGINAIDISDEFVEIGAVGFYGYPWVPQFYDWAFMVDAPTRRRLLEPARALMDVGEIDVFVAHGPMYGVLDRTNSGDRAGCRVLRETMQDAGCPPKFLLCGHIHEAAGVQAWTGGMVVSNAACTQRILELP